MHLQGSSPYRSRRDAGNMITVLRLSSGDFRTVLHSLVLLLWMNSAMCQLRPDYSDLPGKYCETRPAEMRCCRDRMDDCGVGILGTVCYCDQFCDRGLSGDCCPDYFALCLNEAQTQAARDCIYKGKILRFGEIVMDNCNTCACSVSAGGPEVVCGTERCLVEPGLLSQLRRSAERLGWSAANYSRLWGRTLNSGLLQLLGTDRPHALTMARTFPIVKALHTVQLPAEFDARRRPEWSRLIGTVQDQGWCGASWALSTAGTASDRLSIQTGSRVTLSSQQLLDCVPTSASSRGCRGGQMDRAWSHLRWKGVSSARCRRYRSGQTGLSGSCGATDGAVEGSHGAECQRLYRMQPSYRIASRELDIRHEIFTNGPVQALLRVEPDFFLYRSGVYRTARRGQVRAAYHSVRLLDWGEQDTDTGTPLPYWLAANSWGTDWGEDGLFRIRRGTNEADIETFVVGAWARTHRPRETQRQKTADEARKNGLVTSHDEEDQRSLPEETEKTATQDEDQTEKVEASGDDPTEHVITHEGVETEYFVTTETDPTVVTPDDGVKEYPVTFAEGGTDGLLMVDEKQIEISLTSGTEQNAHPETQEGEEKDPPKKPSSETTGGTVTPEKISDQATDELVIKDDKQVGSQIPPARSV